jgi:hypothetical protein
MKAGASIAEIERLLARIDRDLAAAARRLR